MSPGYGYANAPKLARKLKKRGWKVSVQATTPHLMGKWDGYGNVHGYGKGSPGIRWRGNFCAHLMGERHGHGYVAVLMVNPEAGIDPDSWLTIQDIPGHQQVVWCSGKVYMGKLIRSFGMEALDLAAGFVDRENLLDRGI